MSLIVSPSHITSPPSYATVELVSRPSPAGGANNTWNKNDMALCTILFSVLTSVSLWQRQTNTEIVFNHLRI